MMSIVLQRESDDLIMSYLKGADTVLPIQNTQLLDKLESYGGLGLRTLVYAQKRINDLNQIENAETSEIEIIGISAVED